MDTLEGTRQSSKWSPSNLPSNNHQNRWRNGVKRIFKNFMRKPRSNQVVNEAEANHSTVRGASVTDRIFSKILVKRHLPFLDWTVHARAPQYLSPQMLRLRALPPLLPILMEPLQCPILTNSGVFRRPQWVKSCVEESPVLTRESFEYEA